MNFIKLYIGDYLRDTGALTVAEHGAYVLMLMHAYATEKGLPTGRDLHRLLRAETKTERDAIDKIVSLHWYEADGGLFNKRADVEMVKANHQREVNRTVGRLGGRPKRTETESVSEPLTGSEPKTNPIHSQTPEREQPPTPDGVAPPAEPKSKPKASSPLPRPDGVAAQTWDDWLALRRAKKAPVTATVLRNAESEAAKAGMSLEAFLAVWCARGSQGLQADWLKPEERSATQPLSFRERDERAAAARVAEMTGGLVDRKFQPAALPPIPPQFQEVFDDLAKQLG